VAEAGALPVPGVAPAAAPAPTERTAGETPEAPLEQTHWLPLIECMRAVAASVVVVHHLNDLGDHPAFIPQTVIPGFGEWGVDIFFLLSSFLLAEYFWRGRGRRSLRAFYTRRFFRIAPAYYAVLLILFLFFADHKLLFSRFGIKQVLASGTFMHYAFPATASSMNVDGALWTLTIEMLLYLALPLMALAVLWRPAVAVAGMVAVGLGYRVYLALAGAGLVHFYFGDGAGIGDGLARLYLARQFIGFLPVFALGIGLRWLLVKHRLPGRLVAPLRRPSTLIFLLLLVPSLLLLTQIVPASQFGTPALFAGFDLGIGLCTLPLLLYASRPVTGSLPLPLRAGVWLGRRSYGLYLWHFPVILSVYGRGSSLGPPQLSNFPIRVVMVWVLAVGLAAASYSLVEKPAMDYAARLARRWSAKTISLPAAAPV
jgi:peptidoglycan/LPS O-acetylase OafA/YrhL